MAVFRIEKTRDYTVMSNYHLRDMSLSLKAKGLLSLMLSLPENWDYTMKGLARICKDGIDSISGGIRELEAHGYLIRSRVRSANGQLGSIEYTILEQPKAPSPTQEKPIRENPVQANPKEKELKTLLARDEELDGLFERIYEDNVSGKLSDDRFAKMSRRYEDEQKELAEKIKKLRSEIEKQSSRSMTTDMFIGLVRKYTRARKLTPRMLNELIEKIEVFNAEKIDGVWEQRLRIHYNCVGTIEIPTVLPLPIPEVSVNTRKGVVVNYAPCELAV